MDEITKSEKINKEQDTYSDDNTSMEKKKPPIESEFLVELTEVYKCSLCEAVLVSDASVIKHFNKYLHRNRVKIMEDEAEKVNGSTETPEETQPATQPDSTIQEQPNSSELKTGIIDPRQPLLYSITESPQKNISNTSNDVEDRMDHLGKDLLEIIQKHAIKVPFHCKTCNGTFASKEEFLQHVKTERKNNNDVISIQNEISRSTSTFSAASKSNTNINIETIKTLIPLESQSNKIQPTNYAKAIPKLFPTPECSLNYVKKFLKSGPDSIFYTNPQKLKKLKFGLQFCSVNMGEMQCIPCSAIVYKDPQIYYEHFRSKRHIDNVNALIEDDKSFENCREQFSDLDLAKSLMANVSNEVVRCFCCNVDLKNDDKYLSRHMNEDLHALHNKISKFTLEKFYKDVVEMLDENWYYVERFWCEICNMKFSSDVFFANHLETWTHKMNSESRIRRFGKVLVYDICRICGSLWVGFPNTYENHCGNLIHKYMLQNKIYEMPEISKSLLNLLENFEDNMSIIEKNSEEATVFFEEKQDDLLKCLNDLLKPYFPQIEIYVCGSRITGVNFVDSTVDTVLDLGDVLMNKNSENSYYFIKAKQCFLEDEGTWQMEGVAFKEQMPIIQLHHKSTGLKCNVSFGNKLCAEKTEIMKFFFTAYPQCKRMIIFLKKWLFLCQLSDSSNITTFAITWLVIFFLQNRWTVLRVADIMQKRKLSFTSNGWKAEMLESIKRYPSSLRNLSIKQLLIGFFSFYAQFEYSEYIICPLIGDVVKKEVFITHRNVPREMFYNYYNTCNSNNFNIDSPMCLQDPLEYQNNITRSVNKSTLKWFRKYCTDSVKVLLSQKEC